MADTVTAREQRRMAKARNHYLCRVMWDGAQRMPPSGKVEYLGPLPPECQEELEALLDRWLEEGKV